MASSITVPCLSRSTFLRGTLIFVIIVGLLSGPGASGQQPTPSAMRTTTSQYLTTIWNTLNGPHWLRKGGWGNPNVSYCYWYGVCCTAPGSFAACSNTSDYISSIYLPANNLTGAAPDELFLLNDVQPFIYTLVLSYNDISGTYSRFYAFKNLATIDISNTLMSGSLTGIDKMTGLYTLSLLNTETIGTIPSELFSIPQINMVVMGHPKMNGTIPPEISRARNLGTFALRGTNTSGTIPAEVTFLPHLAVFSLVNCGLNGSIPSGLFMMKYIAYVNFAYNNLTGTIPNMSTTRDPMKTIIVSNNRLTGTIPSSIRCSVTFRCSHNFLTGSAQLILSNFIYNGITSLDIAYNNFTASNFITLTDVLVYGAVAFFNAQAVTSLSLGGSNLVGTLSDVELSNLFQSLSYLDLSNNDITGSLPMNFIQVSPSLSTMMISNTNFSLSATTAHPVSFLPSTLIPYSTSIVCSAIDFGRSDFQITGLSPSYFHFQTCKCIPPFKGTPPNCFQEQSSSQTALYIALPIVIVGCLLITVLVLIRRRIVRLRKQREAEEQIAAHSGTTRQALMSNELRGHRQSLVNMGTDLIIPFKRIEKKRTIATGASGTVWLGEYQNIDVAVKEFFPGVSMDTNECIQEAKLHSRLRHPNIVLLMGMCIEPLCTVTEFMSNGSLFHLLRSHPDEFTRPGRILQVATDIAAGMNYLHSKDILHLDLKSLNVLVDGGWNCRVADFGTSRVENRGVLDAGIGTMSWIAPEAIDSNKYSKKCDVYSFGVVMWEIITGKFPFEELKFGHQVADRVMSGGRPDLPTNCSSEYLALMQRCWAHNPDLRPTFEDIFMELKLFNPIVIKSSPL